MSKEEDISIKYGLEATAFQNLESDFQATLQELSGDASLERFKIEYEKLYKTLKISHENEKRLLKRCRDLNADIINNATKIDTALKLAQEDSQTITYLRNEVEKTYKILELSKEREEKNKQKIENLNAEVRHLNTILVQEIQLQDGANETLKELQIKKEELITQRKQLNESIVKLKEDLKGLQEHAKELDQERIVYDVDYRAIKKQLIESKEKVQKDKLRKTKINQELELVKKNYEQQKNDVEKLKISKNEWTQKTELQLKQITGVEQQTNEIGQRISDFTKSIALNVEKLKEHSEIKVKFVFERDRIKKEIDLMKKRLQDVGTKNVQEEKKINKLKNQKNQLEKQWLEEIKEKDVSKIALTHLERQILENQKLIKKDNQAAKQFKHLLDELQKKKFEAEKSNMQIKAKIEKKEKDVKELDDRIQVLAKQIDKNKFQVESLEKEKEKFGIQASQANAKYFSALEKVKLKDNLIQEFQKKNIETENKLKAQQKLYEEVRGDRNLYSKQLTETQDEIAEYKKRDKIVTHQISQLKEEVDAKEVAYAKEHFEHKKKDKLIEKASIDLEKQRKDIATKEEQMKNYFGESEKFTTIFKTGEQERQKLKEEYDTIVAERDMLGTQLIRRNDEAALLYERIKIQEQTLANGEQQYREREIDTNLLNNKIQDLEREKRIISTQAKNIPKMKGEIKELQANLILEKIRVKALSEELENPMNQERYRKLKGSDPDAYEMANKIQSLQRRLIAKTEMVVEFEVKFQQKEKNIQELREIMKRQPGIEEAKLISQCQRDLKGKTRVMKALAAELNMQQADLNKYKYDIEKVQKSIQEFNRKYNELKRRRQLEKEQQYQDENENEYEEEDQQYEDEDEYVIAQQ